MSAHSVPQRRQPTAQEFHDMQKSEQFRKLRATHRNFTFPISVAAFAWYVLYIVMAMFVPEIMAIPVIGHINVGIIFGFSQFVTTFLITWIYIKYANKNIEPRATAIRKMMEG